MVFIEELQKLGYAVLVIKQTRSIPFQPEKHPRSVLGWNSTLESIVKGVPLIYRPFQSEWKVNAAYIVSVWETWIQLESEVERGKVKRAVKRLIVDEEGAEMRERAIVLKEKFNASLTSGGSSYLALDEFVKYLKTKVEMLKTIDHIELYGSTLIL
ncbi:hypothetical protein F2Q68_00029186 [Brassica cretica]|uniref:Uncharacterized protein n=1 Tax=Brassica cretica TaxID=69181 RepID=A0A8S9GEU3_BRACR|nr:hypothetical protein F2Q68_00029186 [Brassica cretica]